MIRVFDWRKLWNAVRLQKALYAETRVYKDVRIHFFCHATPIAKFRTQRIQRVATNAQHRTYQLQG